MCVLNLKGNYKEKRQKIHILQTISNYELNLAMAHTMDINTGYLVHFPVVR